jgi:hypothetical protein
MNSLEAYFRERGPEFSQGPFREPPGLLAKLDPMRRTAKAVTWMPSTSLDSSTAQKAKQVSTRSLFSHTIGAVNRPCGYGTLWREGVLSSSTIGPFQARSRHRKLIRRK